MVSHRSFFSQHTCCVLSAYGTACKVFFFLYILSLHIFASAFISRRPCGSGSHRPLNIYNRAGSCRRNGAGGSLWPAKIPFRSRPEISLGLQYTTVQVYSVCTDYSAFRESSALDRFQQYFSLFSFYSQGAS